MWTLVGIATLLSLAQAEFTSPPKNFVQAEGLDGVFYCQYTTLCSVFVYWNVNGRDISNNLDSDNSTSTFTNYNNITNGTEHGIRIASTMKYNGTVIRCYARFLSFNNADISSCSDLDLEVSLNATLLVQGPLDGVSNLIRTSTNDSITITWDPPFSLDLTTADPDIAYCVDVFNITSDGQREMIVSNCSVLQPQYNFTVDSPDPSDVFEFTVTPRSNVEGAMNGTTSEGLRGIFFEIPHVPSDVITNVEIYPLRVKFIIPNTDTLPIQVDNYTVAVEAIDGLGEITDNVSIAIQQTDDKIELVLTDPSVIGRHRVCLVRISATNRAGTSTSEDIELSTHDVQNIRAFNCNPGQVRVRSLFADGSNATGYLAIVQSLDNVNDISYRFAKRKRGIPQTNTTVDGLNGILYNVTIFDVDERGLPHNHSAGFPKSINITLQLNDTHISFEQSPTSSHSTTVEVWQSSDSSEVCISCIFPDYSTASCVSIIHSTTAHMTSPHGLLNITVTEHLKQYIRACDCIPLLPGDYHVAVFAYNGTVLTTSTPIKVEVVTVSQKPATVKPTKAGATRTMGRQEQQKGLIIPFTLFLFVYHMT